MTENDHPFEELVTEWKNNLNKVECWSVVDPDDIAKFITKHLKDKEPKLSYGKFYVNVLAFIYKLKEIKDSEEENINIAENKKFWVAVFNDPEEGGYLVVE